MRSVKVLLIGTALICVIVLSMIIGINIAWNQSGLGTEEQSVNSVVTNNLDILVEKFNLDGTLTVVNKNTALFGEDTVWTPGHAEVVYLALTNKEDTVVNYSVGVKYAEGAAAKNAAGEEVKLSDALQFGFANANDFYENAADAIADIPVSKTLSSGFSRVGALDAEGVEVLVLVVYLPESVGELTGGEIDLGLSLYVTSPLVEEEKEEETFVPVIPNYFTGSVDAPEVDEGGAITESVTIGADSQISASLPEGVKLAEGTTELSLSVNGVEASNANLSLRRGEVTFSLDVHVEGVASDNGAPILVTLNSMFPKGLSKGNLRFYHVENDETIEMTQVDSFAELDAHNEFYYDKDTGVVTLAMASFSEVASALALSDPWQGAIDTSWYNTNDKEFVLSTPEQLAGFGAIVDGTAEGIEADNFFGKTVKLDKDIDLGGTVSFDPIGWGYDYDGYTKDGKTFNGIFDGQGYTIYNLYQNGWELGYSYGMDGGGLFASVVDATIHDLTIDGAYIVMECIDMGVLVGYSQGSCNYSNINIYNSKIANYQRATGGVVGEVSPKYEDVDGVKTAISSQHTFTGINVDSNTVVGSLWGDFDAPCGGILGAKWDSTDTTKVYMTDCKVACRMDVYNDVTSTYQWYAYRRSGMLIGNTEEGADHKATASFLICDRVSVVYGNWANYHYCEFNDNNSSWPWVRVEAGEHCTAFSNPRWGVAHVDGVPITDTQHTHTGDDSHLEIIPFRQLYGGGQGVYGEVEHEGVTEAKYTITYMDRGEILYVDYVANNTSDYTDIWSIDNAGKDANGNKALGWVDANNNPFTKVQAGNTANIIVYPDWPNEYVVRCIDTKGNVAYYNFITEGTTTESEYGAIATEINNLLATIQNEVDASKKAVLIKWKDASGTLYESITVDYIKNAKSDIILTATPELVEGSISLKAIYDETTGELVAYELTKIVADDDNINVVIPDYIGTTPVTTISSDAAAGFANLHVVTIPVTITNVGSNAFAEKWGWNNRSGETITFYYEGSYNDWITNGMNELDDACWAGLGSGSRIFFLNNTNKVDLSQGYLEYKTGGFIIQSYGEWTYTAQVPESMRSEYNKACDCDSCNGAQRPDSNYWTTDPTT